MKHKLLLAIATFSVLAQAQSAKSIATNSEAFANYCSVAWNEPLYLWQKSPDSKWDQSKEKSVVPSSAFRIVTVRVGRTGTHFVMTDSLSKELSKSQQDCYAPSGKLQFTGLEVGVVGKWYWQQYWDSNGGELKSKGHPIFNSGDRKYILLDVPKGSAQYSSQMKPTVYSEFSQTPFFSSLPEQMKK